MAKLTLTDLANLQNENTAISAINANNTAVETAIDNTLSRDGTLPNQMEATLDMNSNRIINIPNALEDGDPVNLSQITALVDAAILAGGGTSQFNTNFISAVTNVTGTSATYTSAQTGRILRRSNSGSVMLDTLPGTGTGVLTAGTILVITNADTTGLLRLKAGSGSLLEGSTTRFVLIGPGQSTIVYSNGSNYFIVSEPVLARLGGATTIYVVAAGGSDDNSGIDSSEPKATLQGAFDFLYVRCHHGGVDLKIKLNVPGTYTGFNIRGRMPGYFGANAQGAAITIEGDTAAPVNTIIDGGCTVSSGASVYVTYVKITNSAGYGVISLLKDSLIVLNQTNFGTCSLGCMLAQGGAVYVAGQIQISNNSPAVYGANRQGWLFIANVDTFFQPGLAITTTAVATLGGLVEFSSSTFSGTAPTGTRYAATGNGIVYTGGGGASFIPGSIAGVTNTGGIYI